MATLKVNPLRGVSEKPNDVTATNYDGTDENDAQMSTGQMREESEFP